jgi:tRNA(Arg) A34 adenosine deaminase TadA
MGRDMRPVPAPDRGGQPMSAPDAAWSALTPPWREAFELAWQSYRDGGVGIGAVLTDPHGNILGRGRNQRFPGSAGGRLLAHAEMEALAGLPRSKSEQRTTVLHTTLHPCPMCLGATVVARIPQVHFGAFDPTWLGIEDLQNLNDEVRRRWPTFTGPLPGPLGTWAAVLPCLNTSGSLLRAMETIDPPRARIARAAAARLDRSRHLPATAHDALHAVWDVLA